jgi:hypothetical protein
MIDFKKLSAHKWEIIFLVAICFAGILFRTYNHEKWLHFEVDQTWDYKIVSPAVTDGIGNLPLLGPTAGGGRALRLGPAFYYMEYISAMIFGNTPNGHSMTVLIFSILSIPLFYIFIKRYFSTTVSLGLLLLFSTSIYLIMYSRFSWSPNVLPFLVLLSLYSLLKSVSKEENHTRIWFLIMVGSVTISTQIHFNAFFILPAIVISFLLIKRPRFDFKTWASAVMLVFLLYSTVIISEIKTHGENASFFISKLDKKETHRKNALEKTFLVTQYTVYEYLLIISGSDHINGGSPPDGYSLGLKCSKTCASRLPIRIPAILIFFFSLFLLIKKLKKEKDAQRKDFLILSGLWLLFSFLYFYAIFSSNILFPRFFLIISPLAFIFFGFILEEIQPENNKFRFFVFASLVGFLSYSNVARIVNYFNDLKNSYSNEFSVEMKDVFPETKRITFEQEKMVADYISFKYAANGYPVYIQTDHEYEPSFWYLLGQKNIYYYGAFPNLALKNPTVYEQANYFAVYRTIQINPKQLKNLSDNFTILETKELGTLTIYYLSPKTERINTLRQADTNRKRTIQDMQILEIMTWNKLGQPFKPQYTQEELDAFSAQE